ncbi:sugar kinase [Dongia rigui]|uniref:Sugar kinase n=1 Tax=Dongia rigui TaxID=940149 RepID=A0ABU5E1R1_9PROT|nr:sugar kinase [Dongia rigui]MDY0873491.1 sugar kinase [Dongia rigui]
MKIAAIGECMVEFAPDGRDGWQMGFAGDTFNTLWTLRGLLPSNVTTDYVSAFGDDEFSRRQLAFFAQHHVGTANSPHIAGGRPGLYAITLDGAERSFTYWRGDSVARRLADDSAALAGSLKDRKLIYFSGITLAILTPTSRRALLAAVTVARAQGSLIAFDPNYRPRLWPDRAIAAAAITEAEHVADIVLPTFDDERSLFDDVDPAATGRRITDLGVRECVVKNGGQAALLCHDGRVAESPARPGVKAVDTSGAGDAFNGGYLAARLQGREPADAAAFAHRVAALAIGVRGALTPFSVLSTARE